MQIEIQGADAIKVAQDILEMERVQGSYEVISEVVAQRLLDVLLTVETELTEGAAITISDDSVHVRKLPIR
ncbi:MAG: hypothetical protein EWV41_11020 [Microcystis wesenbergii Mw_MB_S_20031200_S109]|jgi:hypothetical protein|uniref:Uncharacterized protein n=2 Tax=Microcystis TaxID=1125 RepID=A0A552LAV1_9CHRO|nr:MAG: hypothetical protein EWV81_06130 [Microcystis aeruginosa Ma_SC_T_19800800_S464]TRV08089.1 MAG: hypothetical protein EWV41_11020 [Microcystis wesenbergii Mw_MB_S_20031200_S109]TRV17335.1 MAG: hypothetical protein EWV88_22440 [Microcystis wesenbergii Mw_MB_S_20031200_S109D]